MWNWYPKWSTRVKKPSHFVESMEQNNTDQCTLDHKLPAKTTSELKQHERIKEVWSKFLFRPELLKSIKGNSNQVGKNWTATDLQHAISHEANAKLLEELNTCSLTGNLSLQVLQESCL